MEPQFEQIVAMMPLLFDPESPDRAVRARGASCSLIADLDSRALATHHELCTCGCGRRIPIQ